MQKIKDRLNTLSDNKIAIDILGSIVSIIAGLLIGFILMLIVNPGEAIPGMWVILKGGANQGMMSIGQMIYFAVPLVLTGLSVAFAFKTGLFNIGATGQLTMGAFVAVYIGVKWTGLGDISPFLHWGTAVLGSIVAGALWGAMPGLLKAYRNVNEVVSSIMFNYIAMYLNTILVKDLIYNQERARARDIAVSAQTPTWGLDKLFSTYDATHNVTLYSSVNIGILLVILVVAVLHILLNHTTFGYELKAVGYNRDAARYAGMNAKRNIVYSMMIAGSVAGLAGAMIFLVGGKNLIAENVLMSEGFTGIAISLLGLSTPIGVFLAALFYGSLLQGGYYIQLYTFKPEIIEIILATIIYFSALSLFLQKYIISALKKKKEEPLEIEKEPLEPPKNPKVKADEGSDVK